MRLTIVIPAYNEEEAIASTIERTLAAREGITARSAVDDVEIIVVSDGSTDGTARIAGQYDDVQLVIFDRNRGYGAAIMEGFRRGRGELVGFLDADGTCDPRFFATLCAALDEEDASVAIGSRLGPASRMPLIRKLGNRAYAVILSALSNRVVTDTASGMRVLRRDVLEQLYPLPDGLHFTPAMSARVLMDRHLKIVERPMPYEERVGDSKLHVFRDGVRFLRTILEMTLMWRPARLFLGAGALCLALMALLGLYPVETRLRFGSLPEDMIYRLLFCSLLGSVGTMLLSAGAVCHHLQRLWERASGPRTFVGAALDRLYSLGGLGLLVAASLPLLGWLVGPGLWTRLTDGYVNIHWSRVVLAGLLVCALGQMMVTILILNLIRFHVARQTVEPWRGPDARISRALRTETVEIARRLARPAREDAFRTIG